MYAVIRSGGKQYRVAPGDVIKVESLPQAKADDQVTFEVLAVSGEQGMKNPQGSTVTGQVVENGRADKILVFHFKRKKQYKRLRGHRQPFTQVRISEITIDGQRFAAPELPAKAKKEKAPPAEKTEVKAQAGSAKKKTAGPKKKAKAATRKGASSKAPGKKKK